MTRQLQPNTICCIYEQNQSKCFLASEFCKISEFLLSLYHHCNLTDDACTKCLMVWAHISNAVLCHWHTSERERCSKTIKSSRLAIKTRSANTAHIP